MKKNTKKQEYTEWFTAEELHEESKRWSSELKFIKDEQKFLNNIIKDYTLDLIDSTIFDTVKNTVDTLKTSEKKLIGIFKKVRLHENQLSIMVDDVNQFKMEKAYLETHKDLLSQLNAYFKKYRLVKISIFMIISNIMKKKKQKRLLS